MGDAPESLEDKARIAELNQLRKQNWEKLAKNEELIQQIVAQKGPRSPEDLMVCMMCVCTVAGDLIMQRNGYIPKEEFPTCEKQPKPFSKRRRLRPMNED